MGSWVRLAVLAALIGAGTGCEGTECGPGTLLIDGRCVAADQAADIGECVCGEFTHMDVDEGRCVLDYPVLICGPNTTECVTADGLVHCVATGCPTELECM